MTHQQGVRTTLQIVNPIHREGAKMAKLRDRCDLVEVHVQLVPEKLLYSFTQLGATLLHMLPPPYNNHQLP